MLRVATQAMRRIGIAWGGGGVRGRDCRLGSSEPFPNRFEPRRRGRREEDPGVPVGAGGQASAGPSISIVIVVSPKYNLRCRGIRS